MNYIELANNFWEKDLENCFSDKEIALYFYLLNTCNRLTWKNPFGQSNAMMAAKFGWGKSSFDSAKKKLKDAGLISFKPGDGRGNVYQYEILNCEIEIKGSKKGTQKITLSDTLSDTLSSPKPETSINLNKTKTKTIKKTNKKDLIFPFSSEKFIERWAILVETPKWKKKVDHALQLSLDRLSEFEEAFALILINEAIEKNYQGVVFDGTGEKYENWKKQKGGKNEPKYGQY